MDSVTIGELAALATAALWTLSALAWTSSGRHIGALAASFIRLAITCVFLGLYGWLVRGLWVPSDVDRGTWVILGTSGFVGFFLADLCLFKAFLLIGPRLALLTQSLAPPLAALLSWAVMGEADALGAKHWLGMAVTLAGVAWVVLERPSDPSEAARGGEFRQGLWLAVVGAVGQAVGFVLSKKGLGDVDAMSATTIRVLGAMVGFLVLITIVGRWPSMFNAARHPRAMAIITCGSVVGPFLGVAMCMVALRHCRTGVAATIINTTPVLILPFAVLVYREKVSLRATGGAVLSVLGVAMLML